MIHYQRQYAFSQSATEKARSAVGTLRWALASLVGGTLCVAAIILCEQWQLRHTLPPPRPMFCNSFGTYHGGRPHWLQNPFLGDSKDARCFADFDSNLFVLVTPQWDDLGPNEGFSSSPGEATFLPLSERPATISHCTDTLFVVMPDRSLRHVELRRARAQAMWRYLEHFTCRDPTALDFGNLVRRLYDGPEEEELHRIFVEASSMKRQP